MASIGINKWPLPDVSRRILERTPQKWTATNEVCLQEWFISLRTFLVTQPAQHRRPHLAAEDPQEEELDYEEDQEYDYDGEYDDYTQGFGFDDDDDGAFDDDGGDEGAIY